MHRRGGLESRQLQFRRGVCRGSTETLNAQVTAVLDDFPVPGAPLGVIANESTPTFTWSAPPSSPGYEYTYQLYLYGDNTNWSMWDMPSTTLSAVYNENGEAYPSTLGGNASYQWSISLRDDDGNEAQNQSTSVWAAASAVR